MGKDKRITFRVSDEQHAEYVRQAKRRGQRLSEFLRLQLSPDAPLGLRRLLVDFRRNWRFYLGL